MNVFEQQGTEAVLDLAEYVRARGPDLARFAYLQLGSRYEAEDVVQDVLTDMARRWSSLQDVSNMDAYARRAIINRRNSLWRRRSHALAIDALQRLDVYAPESLENEASLRITVWRSCHSLKPRQRAAVVLRYYEDLPYERIAEILECTVSTARSLVRRGVQAIEADLKEVQVV